MRGSVGTCADSSQVAGLFLYEMIYTFMKFGHAWSTWRTPFPILLDRGAPLSHGTTDLESKTSVPMSTHPGTFNTTTAPPPAPMAGYEAQQPQQYQAPPAASDTAAPASEMGQPQTGYTGSHHGSRAGTPHSTQQEFPRQQG